MIQGSLNIFFAFILGRMEIHLISLPLVLHCIVQFYDPSLIVHFRYSDKLKSTGITPQEMGCLGVKVDKQAMLLKEYHISCPGSSTSFPLVSFSSVTHCEFICNTLSSINLSVLLLFQSCTLIQPPMPRLGPLSLYWINWPIFTCLNFCFLIFFNFVLVLSYFSLRKWRPCIPYVPQIESVPANADIPFLIIIKIFALNYHDWRQVPSLSLVF